MVAMAIDTNPYTVCWLADAAWCEKTKDGERICHNSA